MDFCAYEPRDIELLVQSIPGEILQYIYISSCAAFTPSDVYPKVEDSPKLKEKPLGPAGKNMHIIKVCWRMNAGKYVIEQPFLLP